MQAKRVYVGVDVSKRHLDVDSFDQKASRINNSKTGITGLIKRIQCSSSEIIVCCEATGGYERQLVEMLCSHGIETARVNPKNVRHFAISKGILAKTDSIDAKVLTEFGRSNKPRTLQQHPSWVMPLRDLLNRRSDLVEMRKQEQSRLDVVGDSCVKAMIARHVRSIKKQITEAEKMLHSVIAGEPDLQYRFSRLSQVQSMGFISSLSLLAFVPELGTVTGNQAAALVGVAPYNNDSGTKSGQRFIKGGRPQARNPLYMAAVSAIRHNPILSDFYKRLSDKGKPKKKAITAVMRKMVVLSNHLLADPDFQIS
jgi:transposase